MANLSEKEINDDSSKYMNIEIKPKTFELSFMNERFIDNTLLKDKAMINGYPGAHDQLIGDMIIETESQFANKQCLMDLEETCTNRSNEYTFSLNDETVCVFIIENSKLSGGNSINTKRVYVRAGNSGLFIVDFVSASVPVKVKTLFNFDDRNGCLDLKVAKTDRLVARKNKAGMKLFNIYNEADDQNVGYELFFKPGIYMSGAENARSIEDQLFQKGIICIYKNPVYAREHIKIYSIAASDCADIRSWHMYFEGNPCVHIEPSSRHGGYEIKLIGKKIKITDKVSEKEVVFDLDKM